MSIRFFRFVAIAGTVLCCASGCKKSAEKEPQLVSTNAPAPAGRLSDLVARVHWLGKKRLLAESNAPSLWIVWNLPDSEKLEAQALDKLALAPWRLATTNHQALQAEDEAPITNYQSLFAKYPAAPLLRPLVEDLLQEECYAEVRQPEGQRGEMVLAVKLDASHAGIWETNLAAVLSSLTGILGQPGSVNGSWRLLITNATTARAASGPADSAAERPVRQLDLAREGDWTIIGLAQTENGLLKDFVARIKRDQAPFGPRRTNSWLEASIDPVAVSKALDCGWSLPTNTPAISLNIIGDGQNVRTHGIFDFPRPLGLELDAWTIPTDLVHDPLIGFTAVRGLQPLLKNLKLWNDLQLGMPPNQAYFWAQQGAACLHFMAVPSADVTNQLARLSGYALNELNPKFLANPIKLGGFQKAADSNGLVWKGMPVFSPTIGDADADGRSFLFAGFFPNRFTNQPAPEALFPQVLSVTNLVCYDWELTGPCVNGLTTMGQLVRRLFGLARLPASPAISWLLALPDRLGNSATAIKLVGPHRLTFSRNSGIGLTAVEIELLVDWLESPDFPRGFHSSNAPAVAETNSASLGGTGGH